MTSWPCEWDYTSILKAGPCETIPNRRLRLNKRLRETFFCFVSHNLRSGTMWETVFRCLAHAGINMVYVDFRRTFQWREYSIWATNNCMLSIESPNEDLGSPNHTFRMCFPGKHFSTIRSPNRVLTPLKSASQGNTFEKVGSALQNLRLGGVNWKVERNSAISHLFIFQNLRSGSTSIRVTRWC